MLFNSFEFALFLPITFLLYWFVFKDLKFQNLYLLIVSYIFYGWWNWKFLILIAITTVCSYGAALLIESYKKQGRAFLCCNIICNLMILCVFKYFNFFADNVTQLFNMLGMHADRVTLDILLPVGISFYTFQAIGYTVDVYRGHISASRNLVIFGTYISFFPQLVAGPIERATNLLPQFMVSRTFDYSSAVDGMRRILWGLFKKMVIADNCAYYVDKIFQNYTDYSGSTLLIGAFFFTFQIYGDFSGYSDIAIGTARLFGFDLMQNFKFPYFSRNIAEFWRRWHISLNTWFRDYIYIPLGGSRVPLFKAIRNTFIIFLVSGLWHGANWTFIVWGLFHAFLFIPLLVFNKNRRFLDIVAKGHIFPSIQEFFQIFSTFILVMFAWVIFRSDTINEAWDYISSIFTFSLFDLPVSFICEKKCYLLMFFILFLIVMEWIQREKAHGLSNIPYNALIRNVIYVSLIYIIIWFGGAQADFIYFQF